MLLISQGRGIYKIVLPGSTIEGGLGKLGPILTHNYHIEPKEIDLAIETALIHEHDTMKFDLNTGRFLYSCLYWKLKRARMEVGAIYRSFNEARELIKNGADLDNVKNAVDRYATLTQHADWENIYSCFDWLEAA